MAKVTPLQEGEKPGSPTSQSCRPAHTTRGTPRCAAAAAAPLTRGRRKRALALGGRLSRLSVRLGMSGFVLLCQRSRGWAVLPRPLGPSQLVLRVCTHFLPTPTLPHLPGGFLKVVSRTFSVPKRNREPSGFRVAPEAAGTGVTPCLSALGQPQGPGQASRFKF